MQKLKEQAPKEETETLAFVLAVFIAQVYKSDALARAIVGRVFMSTDLFRESPLYQSLAREEQLEGMRKLAQAALEGRFQMLSADMLQALSAADETTLKALVAHISSDTLEQTRSPLGLEAQG